MTPRREQRFTGRTEGHVLDVVIGPARGPGRRVRLLVDGVDVDAREARGPRVRLAWGRGEVVVTWWWPGQILTCALVETVETVEPVEPGAGGPVDPPGGERGEHPRGRKRRVTPLMPAPDSPGARLPRLAATRPALYASRHVALATAQVLLTLLGIGLTLRWLLPRIDLSWLPDLRLPDVDLPDIPWPSLDLPSLPDVTVPPEILVVIASWKWWGPILIAVVVAVREVRRRREAERRDGNRADTEP